MELSPAKRALLEKWLKGENIDRSSTIPGRPPGSTIPLSFPQQRQLFLELLERGTAVNNLSVLLEIKGKLSIDTLRQSANRILTRHEALRTSFRFGMGMPSPETAGELTLDIPVLEVPAENENARMDAARKMAEEEVLKPFDLSRPPLLRLRLYRLQPELHLLLVVIHHTIADGWSLGVFLREWMTLYQSAPAGSSPDLPELPVQYADYAVWHTSEAQSAARQASLAYWKEQLGGDLPALGLPTDHPRGARQTFAGGTYRFSLSAGLTSALEKICREEDATLFMCLLTGFFMLLHRYSGQEDILIGSPVANRDLPELENMIGVFINTLALRCDLSGDPGFRGLLRQVRETSLQAFSHQDAPFERLVEILKPERDLSRTPVFQVVFNLQNAPLPELDIPGLQLRFLELDRGVSQFDLSLMMNRTQTGYLGTVEYNKHLFEDASIDRMFRSYQLLLQEAVTQPERPVSRLKIMNEEDLHRAVHERNRTQLDYPRTRGVHQLFELQAEKKAQAVAVAGAGIQLTYDDLNRRANVLARELQDRGVGPGSRVGLLLHRSTDLLTTLLAVLKTGAAYVPIHTGFPPERVRFLLDDASVQVLISDIATEWTTKPEVTIISPRPEEPHATGKDSNLHLPCHPDDPAYIIYTSGSTGAPKGVVVPHAALTNFLWSMRLRPGIQESDTLLAVTALSFDIAALELFLPLITGARVIIAAEEEVTDPYRLSAVIRDRQVTLMQATPATWQMLLDAGWEGAPALKALCGGDVMTRKLADRLLERVDSLWNMYGPTETTIWSSVARITAGTDPITIGRPIGNTQLYILDRHLQPVPPGVVGELHIGGEGLARGYLQREDLTREKFIPDPFRPAPGARLYKTGDQARYLADHRIELLGRLDHQVKINGYRIEPGEVTAQLLQHPAIQEAVAVARSERSGEKRLLAYFVPGQETAPPGAEELRNFLRERLPAYMVPALFIPLKAIPLTPHGKTDRKALPAPENLHQKPDYVAPRNREEQILTRIWESVLDLEQVGIYDNFFDLGGASIQSLQIVAQANMSGLRLSVESIFLHQTIAGLAEHYGEE